jgi:spore coat polysaccharide biosynthesis protein SpsF (cytidylyltransferase family)
MDNIKNIGFIVQARTGSIRFSDKIVREFYNGRSILELLIKRLSGFNNIPVIIATTRNPEDDIIINMAKDMGVYHFRGSEDNVLNRFIEAAQEFNLNYIIRICSDNVFLDFSGLKDIISTFRRNPVDYLSFILSENRPSIRTHFGFWAEIVSLTALVKVTELTTRRDYLEHVTSYIYEHQKAFEVDFINAPEIVFNRNDIRLTVDTEDDFILQQKLYKDLDYENKTISIEMIVDYLDNNKTILEKMKLQISLNRK